MAVEVERKFRWPEGARVDLSRAELGGVRLGRGESLRLDASYFDTPDLKLARNRVTLRRRTGGHDAGWHLKLPGEGHARDEIGVPIVPGSSELQVPGSLRELVADVIGTAPLVPIARLTTDRRETPLLREGRPIALLCEDAVTVTRSGVVQQWREVELELTEAGEDADLEQISTALVALGAEPQPPTSKLVQALGDLLAPRPEGCVTAGQVVTNYLAAQVGMIQARNEQVRTDEPDSVHQMRVATRRLRSALRVFRPLLDAERTEPLRAEVKWLGEVLGGPRDAEVLKARLLASLDELPDQAVIGPVRERLVAGLDARHAETHAALVAQLDSARHYELLDALVGLLVNPPLKPTADRPAASALPELLRGASGRVTQLWHASQRAEGDERGLLAHEARKKAKSARYAWEAAALSFEQAGEVAAEWKQVTETLGVAQDSVVARQRLRELADAAVAGGEPTFTYGVLFGRELAHAGEAHDEADEAIRRARKASRVALRHLG